MTEIELWDTMTKPVNDNSDETFTPDSLANILNNSLQSPIDRRRFLIEGVYSDRKGILYSNGQSYYDDIVDAVTGKKLALKVHKNIKPRLQDGVRYTFSGYLNRLIPNQPKLSISLHFNIVDVLGDTGKHAIGGDEKAELLGQKSENGFKNVKKFIFTQLARDKRTVIHLIVGNEAITDNDFIIGMGASLSTYDVQEHRINLNRVEEIVSKLAELDQEDECIVAVVRGGGELAIFEDVRIAESVLSLKNFLVTAIGHATDVSLLDRVADKSFDTPSFLGSFFKDTAAQYAQKEEESDRRDSMIENLRQEKNRLQKSNDRLTRMMGQKDKALDGIRDSVSSTERTVRLVSSRMIQVASRCSVRNLAISFLLGVITTVFFPDIMQALRHLL